MNNNEVTIIHFNDVYNIEPQKDEPQGGAARLAAYVRHLSIFMKGEQMIPVLNAIGVHCAVYGNHDFDFGVDHLESFRKRTNFPWLISNVTDNLTHQALAEGKVTHMMEWNGFKIGFVGLVEEEWIDTLATLDPEDVTFENFVVRGKELGHRLKQEGADFVIAMTHMRWPNDRRLAEECDEIDIILGGHDHDYNVEMVNGKYIVKSGTDFRNLSKITIGKDESGLNLDITRVDLDSSWEENQEVKDIVGQLLGQVDSKMDEHLGVMAVEMDGKFSSIRSSETNLGNLVTDVMLEISKADVALLNSGTFRSDRIHDKGEFKLRDLLTILPLVDPLVVLKVTGEQILQALENGVSQYPKLEGRFPQVSGMSYGFDPSKPSGNRVDPALVKVQEDYLVLNKIYSLCTKEYIAMGKDGYEVFKNCDVLVSSEQCCTLSTAVRNHFESILIKQGIKTCKSGHRQSLVSLVRKKSLVHQKSKSMECVNLPSRLVRQASVHEIETEQCQLAPRVERRIFTYDDERKQILLASRLESSHSLRDSCIRESSLETSASTDLEELDSDFY
ncbi:Trifunctional nucleotide phosphoesterase protein YfkN [Mizuhopecten yessoensis]|uniref:Trifunctional nucleotide phosphoesterase protein YfkN n=1 Tax=Mizuhopecten yessoensis TaxID=6573 RepID=A0A210PFF3_MIZYE|nr:Trifunctional nucleotide phosphoesterase protein YfkN [Mizuhopecten yessoensis]